MNGKQGKLDHYLNQCYQEFFSRLQKVKDRQGEKNIHKLRLSIKRIKSLLNFIEILNPKQFESKIQFRPFHKIFKEAGRVREIQVNIKLHDAFPDDSLMTGPFRIFLEKKGRKYRSKFKKGLTEFDSGSLRKSLKKTNRLCAKIKLKQVTEYGIHMINSETHEIERYADAAVQTKVIHNIRMKLKSIVSVSKLISNLDPNISFKNINASLVNTEALIGLWHDKIILLHYFELFERSIKNKEEGAMKAAIAYNREKVKDETKILETGIRHRINDLLLILRTLES